MAHSPSSSYDPDELEQLLRSQLDGSAHEPVELAHLPEILAGCERFLDVGANLGQYMFFANRHLRDADVVGIEANPHLIAKIRTTCAQAAVDAPRGNRFEVVHCAISDQPGPLDFYVRKDAGRGSIFGGSGDEVAAAPVESRTLDSFFLPDKKTAIKMDIEGAEYRALRSAQRFLASEHTTFLIELHGWGDTSIHKYPIHVLNLFLAHGYACHRVGWHYVFQRAPLPRRLAGYAAALPELLAKFAVYRWAKGTVPAIRRLRERLSRRA